MSRFTIFLALKWSVVSLDGTRSAVAVVAELSSIEFCNDQDNDQNDANSLYERLPYIQSYSPVVFGFTWSLLVPHTTYSILY